MLLYFLFCKVIIDLISLINIDIFKLCIFGWVLADCVFQGICPFHLGFQMCEHRVIHSIPSVFVIFVVMPPLLFLILVICVIHIIFLVSLTRALSILLILSQNKLFVLLIFPTFFFVFNFINFHSDSYHFSFLILIILIIFCLLWITLLSFFPFPQMEI